MILVVVVGCFCDQNLVVVMVGSKVVENWRRNAQNLQHNKDYLRTFKMQITKDDSYPESLRNSHRDCLGFDTK